MALPSTASSLQEHLQELFDLLKAYARQELIDPLKGAGRYLGYGVAGSLCLGLGAILLLVSLLRVLQTETGDVFDGNWSWAPYFIVLALAGIVIAVALSRVNRKGSGL
ncbi:MAG: phage holin family protein [Acidimicrobiales bacterium]|nr:phage holin family protein [Acidimicrobiales bacterium]